MKSQEYTRFARKLAWLICLIGVLVLTVSGLATVNAMTSARGNPVPGFVGLSAGLSLLFSGVLLGTLAEISTTLALKNKEPEAIQATPAPGAGLRQAFQRGRV